MLTPMDLAPLTALITPLLPVATALIGVLATLGGVRAKAKYDAKVEAARVTREEAKEVKQAEQAVRDRVAARATEIADLFLDELQEVRQFDEDAYQVGFPIWYEERWRTTGDIPFRRAISRVEDADERTRLIEILDSIDDFQALADWKYWATGEKRWVEEVLTLGFDLASTMARGQEPDARFDAQYKEFRTHVDGLASYRDDQREAARQARTDAAAAEDSTAN